MTAPETVRSLDHLGALAAHRVLGWEICGDPECKGCDCPVYLFGSQGWRVIDPSMDPSPGAVRFNRVTFYHLAESLADAWRLVDKLAEDGFHCVIKTPFKPGDAHHAGFTPHGVTGRNGRPDHPSGPAPDTPAAICLAALAAVGHPVRLELGAGEEG